MPESITEDNHKEVFEIRKHTIRVELFKIFEYSIDGLLLAFFAGLENWRDPSSSDAVLREFESVTIQSRLSTRSVIVIFNFVNSRDEFEDPLEKYSDELTNEEIRRIFVNAQEFTNFLSSKEI